MLDDDARYAAICARDRRFDGQFYVGLSSTGIFCKPSCPATKPKRQHVTFYQSAAGAYEAGFRPCLRCIPEVSPHSELWHFPSTVTGRALRLVDAGVVDTEGVGGVASRLHLSTRQLNRIVTEQTGAGLLAHARMRRACTARMLLLDTTMSITDVAFAAGFSSVRQFNQTMQAVYRTSPSSLRNQSKNDLPLPGILQAKLMVRTPFNAAALLRWFLPRSIRGVEVCQENSYSRSLRLPGGPGVITVTPQDNSVLLHCKLTDLRDFGRCISITRKLFDLDADPVGIDERLRRDVVFAGLVQVSPGLRLPGTADPAEMVLRAVVGQQITVESATKILTAAAAFGEPLAGFRDGISMVMPEASCLLANRDCWFRGPRQRRETVTRILKLAAIGRFAGTETADPYELEQELLAIKGIGPWTARYATMRITQATDLFPVGDSGLLKAGKSIGVATDMKQLDVYLRQFSPWRSYACLHLWNIL